MQNGLPMINNNSIELKPGKKAYFISDHHFGLNVAISSREREKLFISWLEQIKDDAQVIFILGDMFDAWFEYKHSVPKGYVRILGKLAELTDSGLLIYFFTGNHDMWMRDYLSKEINIPIFFSPREFIIAQKYFLLGHGDGLGPGDRKYKLLKKLFKNSIAQFLFRWVHPDIGLKIIQYFSQKNKLISGEYDHVFHGKDKEWLFLYAKKYLKKHSYINYFVFGHRHLPLQLDITENSAYYNTGDWLHHFSFLEFNGEEMFLKYYKTIPPKKFSKIEKRV